MTVSGENHFIRAVILLLAWTLCCAGVQQTTEEVLFGQLVNPATFEVDETLEKGLWANCEQDLILLKELVAPVSSTFLYHSPTRTYVTETEIQSTVEENAKKMIDEMGSGLKESLLECIRRSIPPAHARGEDENSNHLLSRQFDLFSSWFISLRRKLVEAPTPFAPLIAPASAPLSDAPSPMFRPAPSPRPSRARSSRPVSSPARSFFPSDGSRAESPTGSTSTQRRDADSNIDSNGENTNHKTLVIAVVTTAVSTFVIVALFFLCCRRCYGKRPRAGLNDERPLLSLSLSEMSNGSSPTYGESIKGGKPTPQPFHNFSNNTKRSSIDNNFVVGSGGQGNRENRISSVQAFGSPDSRTSTANLSSLATPPLKPPPGRMRPPGSTLPPRNSASAQGISPWKPPTGRRYPGKSEVAQDIPPLKPPPGRMHPALPGRPSQISSSGLVEPLPPEPHTSFKPPRVGLHPTPPFVPHTTTKISNSPASSAVTALHPSSPSDSLQPPLLVSQKPSPPAIGKTQIPPPSSDIQTPPVLDACAITPPPPLAPRAPPPPPAGPRAPPPPPMGPRVPPPPRIAVAKSPQQSVGKSQHNEESSSVDEDDAPKTKLKPFFWDKVLANPDHSMVWHQIRSGSFQFNEELIESLFGYDTNKKKNGQEKEVLTQTPVPQFIQILDPKKAQNLSILLRAWNVAIDELCDALREGNELPAEFLQILLKMSPTSDEELRLKQFSGELAQLGPAERFLKALVDTPFAFKRLEAMLFMCTLQEDLAIAKESIDTLEVACQELRNSRQFLKLLEAVLKTGNRMNDGTFRGGAQAFKLDTLLKLSDVKGVDGKTTLLHFVVQEIIRSEGFRAAREAGEVVSSGGDATDETTEEHYRSLGLQKVSGLGAELENVKKAANIDADSLAGTVSKLGNALIKTRDFLNSEMKRLGEKSGFCEKLRSFVQNAEIEITWMLEEEKRIMTKVKSTGDYFHGKAGKDEGLRLFVIVRDFLLMLDKACGEVRNEPRRPRGTQRKEAFTVQPPTVVPPQQDPIDLRQRLFPVIAERRVDPFSSDSDDD